MPKGDLAAEIRQAIADEKMTKTQLYRAGLIAGLREVAELADQWSEARLDEANAPIISGDVFTDGGVFVQSAADANAGYRLMDFAKSIRARIASLETEEEKK